MTSSHGRVLIVDDDEDVRVLMTDWLDANDYEVLTASNGQEGLELIQTEPLDLVILDLQMPKMDGMTVLHNIEKEGIDVPVIDTFFSDQKSRGFNIHKSHMSDPDRIKRLLIAACLAYIWTIYLGDLADKQGFRTMIERTDRADLSLFQLGLRFLAHVLNHDLPVLVAFQFNLIVPQSFIKSVRW